MENTEEVKECGRELFEMVYQWGRVGIVVDEHAPAFQDKLQKLLSRHNLSLVEAVRAMIKETEKYASKDAPDGCSLCWEDDHCDCRVRREALDAVIEIINPKV